MKKNTNTLPYPNPTCPQAVAYNENEPLRQRQKKLIEEVKERLYEVARIKNTMMATAITGNDQWAAMCYRKELGAMDKVFKLIG